MIEKLLPPSQQFHRLVESLGPVVKSPAGDHLLDELLVAWRKIEAHQVTCRRESEKKPFATTH